MSLHDEFEHQCVESAREQGPELAARIWTDQQSREDMNRAVVQAVTNAVRDLPELVIDGITEEAGRAHAAAEQIAADVSQAASSSTDVIANGVRHLANNAAGIITGETTLSELATTAATRAKNDIGQILVTSAQTAGRTADTVADTVASGADRTVSTAFEGASQLAAAGNEALDQLAASGVVNAATVAEGRRIVQGVVNPALENASATLDAASSIANTLNTATFDVLDDFATRVGEQLPNQLGGFASAALDTVDFGRQRSTQAINGAANAAGLAVRLTEQVVNPQQNPATMRRILGALRR